MEIITLLAVKGIKQDSFVLCIKMTLSLLRLFLPYEQFHRNGSLNIKKFERVVCFIHITEFIYFCNIQGFA